MFSLVKKKQPSLPNELVFKSNETSFQYTCSYLSTSLENESPVLAIVLAQKNARDYCMKLLNSQDSSIPTESSEQLPDSGDISNICFQASATDRGGKLQRETLLCTLGCARPVGRALGQGYMAGVLIAKAQPTYSMIHGGWLNA